MVARDDVKFSVPKWERFLEPQNPQNHGRVDIDPGPDGIIENTPQFFLPSFREKTTLI